MPAVSIQRVLASERLRISSFAAIRSTPSIITAAISRNDIYCSVGAHAISCTI